MKKYEFTQDYSGNKKGDVIDFDMRSYHKHIHPLLARGVLKLIGIADVEAEPEQDIKGDLSKLKMGELRDLGGEYDAKDTNKGELIDEIIEKVPLDKIKQFLEDN